MKEMHTMYRYGEDYGANPMRYGGDYRARGGMSRYDREYGHQGSRRGSIYDRDHTRWQRPASPYDREFGGWRGHAGGYGSRGAYDRAYLEQWPRRAWGDHARDLQHYPWEERMMAGRPYPSPWDERLPGQTFGFGLGFGQGRGQYIYK